MAKKHKKSQKKKNVQLTGHKIFYIYKIININYTKKFGCIKCNKIFTNLFILKRHISQIEIKIRYKCILCVNFFPLIKEHYPHCKSKTNYYINNNIKDIKDKKNNDKAIYNTIINIEKITDKYSNDLISTIINNSIDYSFLYFPDF